MKILVSGAAGFIGFHVAKRFIELNYDVVGIDNINSYYNVNLKYSRLNELGIDKNDIEDNLRIQSNNFENFKFIKTKLVDDIKVTNIFKKQKIDLVIHLAAQAGVRYSLKNPREYINSNIVGFFNVLENCRQFCVKHLIYASSSSVYGLNEIMPFSVHQNVDHPISLYAASKKSNELMAHSYSHLYNIPTTGLRFFTVYGPWGRPDMALFIFTKAIIENKPIDIFNKGDMKRDFTYIDDIVEGVVKVAMKPPKSDINWSGKNPDPGSSKAPYKIYNIGNNNPIKLMDFIKAIEKALNKTAKKNYMSIQAGDVPNTYADVQNLVEDFNYKPSMPLQKGINNFVNWYFQYYK